MNKVQQKEVERVAKEPSAWLQDGPQGAIVRIAISLGHAERLKTFIAATSQSAPNEILAGFLNAGVMRMQLKLTRQKKQAEGVERAAERKKFPFPWCKLSVDIRRAMNERLRQAPFPWSGMHQRLAQEFDVDHRLAKSLLMTVALYGFDDPYLLGLLPIKEQTPTGQKA